MTDTASAITCPAAVSPRPDADDTRPVAVDLFAGAGGFSLGAFLAGFRVRAALEVNASAAATYRHNLVTSGLTDAVLCETDILDLCPVSFMERVGLEPGDCGLLVGGPPCQGFSSHRIKGAGVGDPRNRLLLRYFEYVRALRPAYFLVENVPGMLWPRHGDFLRTFLATALAAGYDVSAPLVLNACSYGVPQNRKRVFILGRDMGVDPPPAWPPARTHVPPAESAEGGAPAWNTAAQVFASPPPACDPNDVHMASGSALTEVFRSTPHDGGSRKDSARKLDCHASHDGHSDVYGRIDPRKPGPTMTTACINPSKGRFVHPRMDHGITLRQAARFQTFPDWYVFKGGLMAGGAQVGNAVPVEMARVLLRPIADALAARRPAEGRDVPRLAG